MKFGTVVVCSKCKQPIVSGQGYGYIHLPDFFVTS